MIIYDLLFRSDLPNIIQVLSGPTLVVGLLAFYRKHNCHTKGCPWIGRYPAVEGNGWYYCRGHHRHHGVNL